ncbi:MAG: NUDIX hydrolase [Parcubacteria group bacterium]|jgi:8-oxo-dGTP pyrophosphatase MutT (NUDIX family)
MAYYNKIGLLVLNAERTSFLVCEPGLLYKDKSVSQYLMPGGQFVEETVEECLKAEIREELGCDIDIDSIKIIGEYSDVAASGLNRDVMIRLYAGRLIGTPIASTEIGALHWVGESDIDNEKLSPIIRNKIIPDLIRRRILKKTAKY